jgi:putative membrane protein
LLPTRATLSRRLRRDKGAEAGDAPGAGCSRFPSAFPRRPNEAGRRDLPQGALSPKDRTVQTAVSAPENRAFFAFNAVLSTVALAFLAWLLLFNEGSGGSADLSFLPAVNAGLNSTAAALLVAGWIAIKRGNPRAHRYSMVAAFVSSALFLVSYVVYHYAHGDTRYAGEGPMRLVYFAVLISHVVLSIAIVPMALSAFWFAYRKRFASHKKVTRVLAPIWLYVSVTGVVIFLMLRAAGS